MGVAKLHILIKGCAYMQGLNNSNSIMSEDNRASGEEEVLGGTVSEDLRLVTQTSVEEAVRSAVVTASNHIIRTSESVYTIRLNSDMMISFLKAGDDFYANGTNRLQNVFTTCLATVMTRTPAQQYGVGVGVGWYY